MSAGILRQGLGGVYPYECKGRYGTALKGNRSLFMTDSLPRVRNHLRKIQRHQDA